MNSLQAAAAAGKWAFYSSDINGWVTVVKGLGANHQTIFAEISPEGRILECWATRVN